MRGNGTSAPGRGVCLFASCILFAKQLDRNGEQRRFGSIPMRTMPDGRFVNRTLPTDCYARMAARARNHARMTPLERLLLVEMSVDRFSHHVLPRIARTQKHGSRSFRNMIPTAA